MSTDHSARLRTRAGAALTAVVTAAVLAAAPGAGAAQETDDPGERAGGAGPTENAPLIDAPFQFRVGPTVGSLSWEHPSGDGVQRMDDAVMWGLDVASVVGRYAGFRLGGAVGSAAIASGETEFDAVQYLVDVVAEGRLAAGPLHDHGVIPFVAVGGGAAVHDPAPDSLITRSQSTFIWGAGVEARLHDRAGARAEWRRVQAEIQDAADPVDRTGTTRFADRFFLGVYWVF